eukprot:TRINITY_DN4221_c1_g3_i1.p1 TRINITY_DN4221_c1_g3~~TRINITY_DN4221_c1_g3_i1.p1  ORF type:complete len:1113 (+),score=296.35 TRINITY_DN4221_c1_g3_i1:92-3430(+)
MMNSNQMYYYVAAVPNGCGQGQVGQFPQVGDGCMGQGGMTQGGFDPNQQMQNFNMGGGNQGYGAGAGDWQHDGMQQMQQMGGQMQGAPQMMGGGGTMPQQQMVLMMMPNHGIQGGGGQMMDQSGGCGGACGCPQGQVGMGATSPSQWGSGCCGGCGGCGAPPQAQVNNSHHPVPPAPPQGTGASPSAQEAPRNTAAFKIVDPKTAQEVVAEPKTKKLLKNVKLEKKKEPAAPGASAASAPSSESALAEVPKASASESAKAQSSEAAATANAPAVPGASPEKREHAPLPQIPTHHRFGAAVGPKQGQGQNFASSIKALNLEPMRASNSRSVPSKPPAPAPAPLQRSSEQAPSQAQAPLAAAGQDPTASQELSASEALAQQQPQQLQQLQQQPPQQMQQIQQPQQQQQMQHMPQLQQMQMQPQAFQQQQMMMMQMQMHQPQQMLPMSGQAMQPVPAPAPATAAASGSSKQKGLKIQNVSLKKAKAGDTGDNIDEKKEEAKPHVQAVEIAPPLALEASSRSTAVLEDVTSSTVNASAAALAPKDAVFQRELMLRIWRMNRQELHSSVSALGTSVRVGDTKTTTPDIRRRVPTDRGFGSAGSKNMKKPEVLKASEKGYKITEASSRMEDIERRVRSLLNKICPDNLGVIVEQLAHIELFNHEELEYVIRIIFGKALSEPHYCETYADMVFTLKSRYPEFPPQNPDEKPHTFVRVLLNTCQNEFENLPTTFSPNEEEIQQYPREELNLMMKQRKDKMLANMKFIGHLFLRQLLAVKVIGQVVHDLIGIKEAGEVPEEHMIECVCELLQAIGYTLDETPHGKNLMDSFAARLKDLSRHQGVERTPDGKGFTKRIRFQIEDLLDLRREGWRKKLFKEQAKSKEEIRKDAARDERKGGKGGQDTMFSTQVLGVRPAYIDEQKVRPAKPKVVEQKVVFDLQYVKKMFQYYSEEKNGDSLASDWAKAQTSSKDAKQGMEWLMDIGFNDGQKADRVAETIAELMSRKVVQWDVLREALLVYTSQLEDILIDVPTGDRFVHCLLSRLISLGNFSPSLLKALEPLTGGEQEQKALAWKLLLGTLRKLKEQDSMKKALNMNEFAASAASAKGCTPAEAKRQLEQEL